MTNEGNTRYGQPTDNNNIAFMPRLGTVWVPDDVLTRYKRRYQVSGIGVRPDGYQA